jgi:hypothetical protein
MRSLLAIALGYGLIVLLVAVKFEVLKRRHPGAFTSKPWLAGIVATDGLSAFAGGYSMALIAGQRAWLHAGIMLAILVPLGIALAVKNAGREPLWFQASVQVALAGGILSGAWLFESLS